MRAPSCTSQIARNCLAAAILLLVLLTGCTPTAVVVWTDTPELVTAVELFNASESEHVIELVYEPELGSALRLTEDVPDLVVGSFIEDRATALMFRPLDRFVRRELDEEEFYPELFATGKQNGHYHLLPVAFNLPLLYFTSPVANPETEIVISPEEIRSLGEAFNASDDNGWARLAYSPIWDTDFLYQFLRLGGLEPHEGPRGEPDWSFENLVRGVSNAREWVELHGGVEADLPFQAKYLYDPDIQLVRQGRIAFGYDTSNRYLTRTDAQRNDLDFRWLGGNGTIHVLEDAVYAGIPQGAESRQGAERFLAQLLSVNVQRRIIENNLRKRVDTFGVAGGFSSLWRLNESYLCEYYPELEQKIPPAGRLDFPPASPRHWNKIVDDVVEPWLLREVLGRPQSRDLEESVRAWLLQQED
ncbi:MAG: hypothetical protein ACLFUA_06420 [Spirochaetales bacterium]